MIDVGDLPLAAESTVTTVYAIGDIHGRLDLLDRMEATIAADIVTSGAGSAAICYLGDYIDRGPHSAQVIDRLCRLDDPAVLRIFLKGNHEDRMLEFLIEPEDNGPAWMRFGGREALESYGLNVPDSLDALGWQRLRDALAAVLPPEHLAFLENLELGWRWGDYLFVHAGLNPDRPVAAQAACDLMWIREPFLSSARDWGFVVVHGHVICDEPETRPNRIGIDTGAYQSGRLTCLVLHGNGQRFLQVEV